MLTNFRLHKNHLFSTPCSIRFVNISRVRPISTSREIFYSYIFPLFGRKIFFFFSYIGLFIFRNIGASINWFPFAELIVNCLHKFYDPLVYQVSPHLVMNSHSQTLSNLLISSWLSPSTSKCANILIFTF